MAGAALVTRGYATPSLEARIAPVLIEQSITFDEKDRTPGRRCWAWNWAKSRDAQPIAETRSIAVDGTTVEFPAFTERRRDGQVIRSPEISSLGPGRNDL